MVDNLVSYIYQIQCPMFDLALMRVAYCVRKDDII